MLAFNVKGLALKDWEVLLQWNRVLLKPIWNSAHSLGPIAERNDTVALEAVQRKFIRFIPEMRELSSYERLDSISLYSFEFKLMWGDIIQT